MTSRKTPLFGLGATILLVAFMTSCSSGSDDDTDTAPPNGTITAPAADATINPGQAVSFSGTATDPDGNPLTVVWDFGDGSTSTLLAPGDHTYAAEGTYSVTFTATNSEGVADPTPATRTVTVQTGPINQAPSGTIATPVGDVNIAPGQTVSFSGTTSDPNSDSVTVVWDFGDGSTTSTLLTPGAHTYAAAGTYTVTFTATDSQGLADPTPDTRTITVSTVPVNQAPNGTITAPAANVSITAGQSVSFTGTTTDPESNPVTVLWNFGDGSATSTLLAPGSHTYAAAGTYTVTFTATDSLGLADPTPATRTITVTAVAATTLTQVQTTVFISCTGCHDAGGSAGLDLRSGQSYANLVNVPATTSGGVRVSPGNPGASVLVSFLASGHRSVSLANRNLISSWISGGALNN